MRISYNIRADSRFAPSEWETSLQSNAVSHWLSAKLESDLYNPQSYPDVVVEDRIQDANMINTDALATQ